MASTVLNSPRAVAMSLYIIRAFVKMREDLAANAVILKRLAEIDKTLLLHDGALREIYQQLQPLLAPPPAPPKPEIGFHAKEDALPCRKCQGCAPTQTCAAVLELHESATSPKERAAPCCVSCGSPVQQKVVNYCRIYSKRFGGRLLCQKCQFEHKAMAAGPKAVV